MALLAPLRPTTAGTAMAYNAAGSGAGDTLAPGAASALLVKNASGGSLTVTIDSAATVDGIEIGPITVNVPNTTERLIQVPARLADPATGLVTVTYSVTASVTVAHIGG